MIINNNVGGYKMRQRYTVSQLTCKSFPECTKVCQHYALTRNCFECKQICSGIKEINEASILKVELKESLLV